MLNTKTTTATLLAALVGLAATAPAAVIFSDSFNRADNNTVGTNDNALGGTISQTWIEHGDAAAEEVISSNALRLDSDAGGGGSAWVVPNHNFNTSDITTAGGFILTYTVDPIENDNPTRWGAVSFGHSSDSATGGDFVVLDTDSAFGFLVTDNGTYQVFEDGLLFESGDTGDAVGPYAIEITVLTTDFSDGANATASVTVDGTAIDLDDDIAGVQTTHAFTWNTGDNYFNFEGIARDSTDYDDVKIELIPEPATLALLGLGGAVMLGGRRRRA